MENSEGKRIIIDLRQLFREIIIIHKHLSVQRGS